MQGEKNHEPTEQIKSFLTFVHVKQFKQSESAAGKLNFFLWESAFQMFSTGFDSPIVKAPCFISQQLSPNPPQQ